MKLSPFYIQSDSTMRFLFFLSDSTMIKLDIVVVLIVPVWQTSKTFADSGFVSFTISQHKCQMQRFEIGFCCSAKQVGILLDV